MDEENRNSQRSPISLLPNELLIAIFEYLSVSDREYVSLVCRRWLNIIDSNADFQTHILNIDEWNHKEIFETYTINRLIARGKLRNIFLDSIPYKETIKILRNMGPHINSLHIRSENVLLVLKTCAVYLVNLSSLEFYDINLGPVRGEEVQSEIVDFNCLINLRTIKCKHSFYSHFLSFANPLESVSVSTLGDQNGQNNYFLTILNQHATSIKSISIFSVAACFTPKVQAWIEALNKLCCLEDLELKLPNLRQYDTALMDTFTSRTWNELKRIHFDDVLRQRWEFLEIIATNCPNIRAVHLCGKEGFPSSRGMEELLKILEPTSNLTELILHSIYLSEDSVCALARNLPNLRVLDLAQIIGVTDRSLHAIYRYLTNIRVLSLRYYSESRLVTLKGLVGISGEYSIQGLKCLNTLTLHGDNQNINIAIDGLRCKELRNLYLERCRLTPGSFRNLAANCPNIEKLILRECKGFRGHTLLLDRGVKALSRLRKFMNYECR